MTANASSLNPRAQSHLLGIVRESVANALRHSRGKNIWISFDRVTLACTKDKQDSRNSCLLEVRDDGIGITEKREDSLSADNHFGLSSLRFRAAAIGGQLEIQSTPGQGTTIRVSLPASDPTYHCFSTYNSRLIGQKSWIRSENKVQATQLPCLPSIKISRFAHVALSIFCEARTKAR
ncbi:MAG: sensor histidine kinase [bacterium]